MRHCSLCNAEILSNAIDCPYCGYNPRTGQREPLHASSQRADRIPPDHEERRSASIVSAQRMMLRSIMLVLLCMFMAFLLAILFASTHRNIVDVITNILTSVAMMGFFLTVGAVTWLAIALRKHPALVVIYTLGMFTGAGTLAVIGMLNSLANDTLKADGYKVGFLGARRSEPPSRARP